MILTLRCNCRSNFGSLVSIFLTTQLIFWMVLFFFLQPNWVFEWCYLVCLFIILSSLVWLIHYLLLNTKIWNIISATFIFIFSFYSRFFIDRSVKRQENREKKKSKKPYWFKNVIPFLPSMIIWFILEIILRQPIIQNFIYNW